MNFDDSLRQADPARGDLGGPAPGLLDRVLDAGPARRPTGTRTAVLAGVVTAAVMLSVVAGLRLGRDDAPVTAGAPAAKPVDCLALLRGWRPTYLPPGFAADGSEEPRGSEYRGEKYAKKVTTQPTSQVTVMLDRWCKDPAKPTPSPEPPVPTNSDTPKVTTYEPEWRTVRGHRASLFDHEHTLWLQWEEAPGLSISLQVYNSNPQLPNLSLAELLRIAEGLVHEKVTADPTPAPPDCPGLTGYRARTLPAGYRADRVESRDENNLLLTYVKGTGADRVNVVITLGCNTVLEHEPPRGMDPVTVHGKAAWISPPSEGLQIMWREGPNELWVLMSADTAAQPTRDELLTIAEGLRAG